MLSTADADDKMTTFKWYTADSNKMLSTVDSNKMLSTVDSNTIATLKCYLLLMINYNIKILSTADDSNFITISILKCYLLLIAILLQY